MIDSIFIANCVLGFGFTISIVAITFYGVDLHYEQKAIKFSRIKKLKSYIASNLRSGYKPCDIELHLTKCGFNSNIVRKIIKSTI